MEVAKFTKNNLLQRLKNNYIDDEGFPLEPADLEKKRIFEKIWALRDENKYHKSDIIKILMRPKNRDGENLPRTTAYNFYNYSMQLFGNLDSVDSAAEKAVARSVFHDLYLKSYKLGDFKTATKAYENYVKLIPEDKSNDYDPEKLKASIYKEHIPKPAMVMFKNAKKRGVVDLMFFKPEDVDDADFEEVKDDEDDEH
ncbi:hypothetical protein [Chryseobacterium terrae]|uniref:Uncharacterized protein n=1 Tax=Chryseobacterium terrae TaxID=3163299 RepID=A0ABW8Y4G4_9FLAO